MIDLAILESFGSSNSRLKEIFTAVADDTKGPKKGESSQEKKERLERSRKLERDIKVRKRFELEIQARLDEGINHSLKNWRMWAAVDMAYDSSVINKMTLPLLMFAQGKINVARCASQLEKIKVGCEYIQKDEKGTVTGIDIPKFMETEVNLVRSVILRRWAAQKNKYNNLWPFYGYEARTTGLVGKCRADVLSQRVDIMADQFDYRHHDAQVQLDALLYGFQLDFCRCSWEVEKQYRRKTITSDPKEGIESYVTKEGIGWFNPHPSRVAWDNAYPLPSINTDTGCEWVSFWDIVKFGEIDDNPFYFNKRSVGWTNRLFGTFSAHQDYFNQYNYTMAWPNMGADPSTDNDSKSNQGVYASTQRDSSVIVSNYFRKLVPKDYGIGEYPYPVWVRFVTASDNTVVFAEFYPSTPAAHLGINTRDSRQASISMAMDLLPYQQQMSNLLTRLLMLCQMESFKAIGINTDALTPEQAKKLESVLSGPGWYDDPLVFGYSLAKLAEMGIKEPKDIIQISEAKQSNSITVIFEAIIKLVSLVERMMALSPNEQGQPAPREISAKEVSVIENTTSSIYSSISDDIDEFRSAKKRIIYESLVACGKADVEVPVRYRYTQKTIAAAGFKPKAGEDDDVAGGVARRVTVIGTPRALVHDYIFTSRDGAERPVNTQAANTLVQLIAQVLAVPPIVQKLGKEKIYMLFNEVFRMSGAGIDLNLEVEEGEDNSMGQDEVAQLKQVIDEMQQYLQQMAGALKQNSSDIAEQVQVNEQQEEAIGLMSELGDRVKKAFEEIEDLRGKHDDVKKSLSMSIPYDKTPASVQAQLEMRAGLVPAPASERMKPETNGKTVKK